MGIDAKPNFAHFITHFCSFFYGSCISFSHQIHFDCMQRRVYQLGKSQTGNTRDIKTLLWWPMKSVRSQCYGSYYIIVIYGWINIINSNWWWISPAHTSGHSLTVAKSVQYVRVHLRFSSAKIEFAFRKWNWIWIDDQFKARSVFIIIIYMARKITIF